MPGSASARCSSAIALVGADVGHQRDAPQPRPGRAPRTPRASRCTRGCTRGGTRDRSRARRPGSRCAASDRGSRRRRRRASCSVEARRRVVAAGAHLVPRDPASTAAPPGSPAQQLLPKLMGSSAPSITHASPCSKCSMRGARSRYCAGSAVAPEVGRLVDVRVRGDQLVSRVVFAPAHSVVAPGRAACPVRSGPLGGHAVDRAAFESAAARPSGQFCSRGVGAGSSRTRSRRRRRGTRSGRRRAIASVSPGSTRWRPRMSAPDTTWMSSSWVWLCGSDDVHGPSARPTAA